MRDLRAASISRRGLVTSAAAFGFVHGRCERARAEEGAFPLVTDLDWLAKRAAGPDLRVFDVSPLHVWRRGHIDSARHAWWRDTVDPNYPVFGAVLTQGDEQAHRQQVLDSLELLTGDRVVVYDNANGFRAARLVWFLRFIGFRQVALLNASFADWQANSFSITSASSSSASPVVDPQEGFYLVTEQVLDRLATPDLQLIDIRTDKERSDDLGGTTPPGQIPGSIRLPWNSLLDESGHLRSVQQIEDLLTARRLDADRPSVLYGRFGVDTALSWLALRHAGMTSVQNYDRGWAEWSTAPDLPREPLA